MQHRWLSIPAFLLASSGAAAAASLPEGEVAVARRPEVHAARPAQADPSRPTDLLVISLTGGAVFIPGRGWGGFGRGGAETIFCRNADCTGPLYGVTSMWEGYSAPASHGLSLLIGWTAGFATRRLLATAGFGINVFSFDTLNKAAGAGVLSPRADIRLGVRVGPRLAFAASAEMQYRWSWGIEDQRVFGLGLSLLYVADAQTHH